MARLKINKFKVPITLSFIVLFFILYPFIPKQSAENLSKMSISIVLIIIPCLSMFVQSRKKLIITTSLAAFTLLLAVIEAATHNFLIINLVIICEFLFFLITFIVVIKHIYTYNEVTLYKILSSILGYLLIAFLFAFIYTFASLYHPNLLTFTYGSPELTGHVPGAFWNFSDTLYFSLVTLSSLGYGDIAPALDHCRMFAALEAVVGQMYLAVFVARLVGLMISQNVTRKEDKILREIKEKN